MRLPVLLSCLITLSFTPAVSQNRQVKPKLVVAIIVDQMRNDFIYRYWDRYGENGFKRLVNEGFHFKNAHYNYIPTYTGPGHASIFTGTTPKTHGIIGNDWYTKRNNGWVSCVGDNQVKTVGNDGVAGQASPKNLLASTIGDELTVTTNKRSKIFTVALKDRSAIFPAGHTANGAYWFDEAKGEFVSSTWYCTDLPDYVKQLNSKKPARAYLEKGWTTLYPLQTYSNSIADENTYEGAPFKNNPSFPYDFKTYLEKNETGIIRATPFGNSITKDLAIQVIQNEELGKDEFPDLFSISFSSTDVVAHCFGPRAIETEDVYLRLDRDITELLSALDQKVGKGNYTVFLTADHGGADVPSHLLANKIPAGYLRDAKLSADLKKFFKDNYGDTILLANLSNEQIFINHAKMYEMKLDRKEVEERLAKFLLTVDGIAEAYTSSQLMQGMYPRTDYAQLLQNGYNHKLSGNVAYIYQPAWMDYAVRGTTHGAGYNYDTHVPIIFYGAGIKPGYSYNYTTITQVAPTVCELLLINQPNGCVSEPLNNYFK